MTCRNIAASFIALLILLVLSCALPVEAGEVRERVIQRVMERKIEKQKGIWAEQVRRKKEADLCRHGIPDIAAGYGSNGPYRYEMHEVHQSDYDEPIQVFLPVGAQGKRPVVFFTHGYGPNVWKSNVKLIEHVVSHGMIFVFAPYRMPGKMDDRYNTVWNGFVRAVNAMGGKMDMTRVGFIGHSFGGGANPAMAYRGIVETGWGSRGAFILELAPWFSFEMTQHEFNQFPSHVIHGVQVYDQDVMNDHRMSIDLYNAFGVRDNLFMMVRSENVNGCDLIADHGMPGHGTAETVRQYGLLKPLDMMMDAAFSKTTLDEAIRKFQNFSTGTYQPVEFVMDPVPEKPEDFYKFKWSGRKNPRIEE